YLLVDRSLDHFDDVSAKQRHLLARNTQRFALLTHGVGHVLELSGPGHDRRQVEAVGLLDLAFIALARKTLAVRTVAADDETAFYEDCKMPAQGRCRHSVGTCH